jgi:nucleotide-binding universal stress UspA family protein
MKPKKKATVATVAKRTNSSRRHALAARKASRRDRTVLKLLIVLDASEASKRVLQYIGQMIGEREQVEYDLAYIAPRMPAQFLESGGSELPERELEIESNLRAQQNQWITVNDSKPDRILSRARATLLRAGASAVHIHSCISSPLDTRTVADEVILLARDQQCGTIVVGHRAHSWFRGLGRSHLAEHLVRSAKGYAVWVVD